MSFHILKTSLLLSCVVLMATGPVEAIKYRNGKIVHEDREIGGGEGFVSYEHLGRPSAVKKYERSIVDDDYASRLDSEEYKIVSDIGPTVYLLERTLKAGSQKMHWDSRRLAPRPEKVEDIPPFDPRRIVRRLGLIPPPKNEEEAKFSQVKVYDYNPNGYLFNGQMKARGVNIRVVGYKIYYDLAPIKWEATDYEIDRALYRSGELENKLRAMSDARKSLKAELTHLLEERLKLMKMVAVERRPWRLIADTEEALISKMKDVLQPEQLYEIYKTTGDWDHAQRQYKTSYIAKVMNRPQLLQAMYPDSGIFQYAGTGGSFRKRCEIDFFNVGFPEDPGKCLPAGSGGNYRRGHYFNVTDEFTADPGSSLLFQVVTPYFPYGPNLPSPYKSKQDRWINVNDRALIPSQPVVMSCFDKVRDTVQKRQNANHRIAFKARLERESQMFPPLKITHSDPGQMAPAGSGGNYRRGYHDNVAPHISRHRIGTKDLPLIFPLEFDDSGRHFKGYNKFHSTCREPMMSCADPGQLLSSINHGHYRRDYHDNVASEMRDDPGRLKPIGNAPTAHFSRPVISVEELNAVIARFKHVELIGE